MILLKHNNGHETAYDVSCVCVCVCVCVCFGFVGAQKESLSNHNNLKQPNEVKIPRTDPCVSGSQNVVVLCHGPKIKYTPRSTGSVNF